MSSKNNLLGRRSFLKTGGMAAGLGLFADLEAYPQNVNRSRPMRVREDRLTQRRRRSRCKTGGRNFYYSDYRIAGGLKVDYWENFTCCSGTYIQDMADHYNLIYYQDASSLYVNLYAPSEVASHWGSVVQQTGYPETETSAFSIGGSGSSP